jgi:hypothetical protein
MQDPGFDIDACLSPVTFGVIGIGLTPSVDRVSLLLLG